MFYVYCLKSKINRGQTYIGYSADLKNRLKRHNASLVSSTKPYMPWELVFYEAYKNKSDAKMKRILDMLFQKVLSEEFKKPSK